MPSSITAPVRVANQGDQLATHDTEAADPVLHAGSTKLQGYSLATQLRREFGAQLAGASVLYAALTPSLLAGIASVSFDQPSVVLCW